MGETPHAFVLRRRLENALGDISQGNRQPLTDIALSRGFRRIGFFQELPQTLRMLAEKTGSAYLPGRPPAGAG
ncbi:hypothetical protein MP631_14295 [Xanthomonas phaseoli pv. phaseoli]|nr:hypothetical protein MP631_14295 [Xanthomonas phaseoli pv. phaseoli]